MSPELVCGKKIRGGIGFVIDRSRQLQRLLLVKSEINN